MTTETLELRKPESLNVSDLITRYKTTKKFAEAHTLLHQLGDEAAQQNNEVFLQAVAFVVRVGSVRPRYEPSDGLRATARFVLVRKLLPELIRAISDKSASQYLLPQSIQEAGAVVVRFFGNCAHHMPRVHQDLDTVRKFLSVVDDTSRNRFKALLYADHFVPLVTGCRNQVVKIAVMHRQLVKRYQRRKLPHPWIVRTNRSEYLLQVCGEVVHHSMHDSYEARLAKVLLEVLATHTYQTLAAQK